MSMSGVTDMSKATGTTGGDPGAMSASSARTTAGSVVGDAPRRSARAAADLPMDAWCEDTRKRRTAVPAHGYPGLRAGTQLPAVQRFAARCGTQRGFLVMHTMGSGKTLIGLAFLANFGPRFTKTVIVPPGIQTAWMKDMAEWYFGRDFQCSINFLDYKQLSYMTADDLLPFFENAVVVADEAHILVRLLRGENAPALRRSLSGLHRVLLLTGTPVQKSWGDLGVLINICAGQPLMPGSAKRFDAAYSPDISSRQNFLLTAWDTLHNFVTPARVGVASAAAVWWSGMNLGLSSAATGVATAVATKAGLATAATIGATVGIGVAALGVGAAILGSVAVAAISRQMADSAIDRATAADMSKVKDAVAPFVSYFDYNDLPADSPALGDYPHAAREEYTLPWTDFQWRQLKALSNPQYRQTTRELVLFGETDLDLADGMFHADWTDASTREDFNEDEFRSRLRALGNLEMSGLYYRPQRAERAALSSCSIERPLTLADVGNRTYRAKALDAPTRDDDPMTAVVKSVKAAFKKAGKTPPREDVLRSRGVFWTPKFQQALELCLDARRRHHFLPVVYSNFDLQGMEQFSAYLTSYNLPHIIIHPEDARDTMDLLVAIANMPHVRYCLEADGSMVPDRKGVTRVDDSVADAASGAALMPNNLAVATEVQRVGRDVNVSSGALEVSGQAAYDSERAGKPPAVAAASAATASKNVAELQVKFDQAATNLTAALAAEDAVRVKESLGSYTRNDLLALKLGVVDPVKTAGMSDEDHADAVYKSRKNLFELRAGRGDTPALMNSNRLAHMRNVLQQAGTPTPTYVATDGTQCEWKASVNEVPFCVLLHPAIREGVGFDLAPLMVCLEVPEGYGNQEQIYARCLRSVNATKRTLALLDGTLQAADNPVTSRYGRTNSTRVALNKSGLFGTLRGGGVDPRPWRVVKRIAQLFNGVGQGLYTVPSWARAMSGNTLPPVVPYMRVARFKRVVKFASYKATEGIAAAKKDVEIVEKQREEEEGGGKLFNGFSFPSSGFLRLFDEDDPYYDEMILRANVTGVSSLLHFRIVHPNQMFLQLATAVWAPPIFTRWGEYASSKAPGSFSRWLSGNKHPLSIVSADETTSTLNSIAADKLRQLSTALRSIGDADAPCHLPDGADVSAATNSCDVWGPSSEADELLWRESDRSCIVKQDAAATAAPGAPSVGYVDARDNGLGGGAAARRRRSAGSPKRAAAPVSPTRKSSRRAASPKPQDGASPRPRRAASPKRAAAAVSPTRKSSRLAASPKPQSVASPRPRRVASPKPRRAASPKRNTR